MRNGEQWSDTHGTFEHNSPHGFAGEAIDPRDFAPDWFVAQHHNEAFERGDDRAAFHNTRAAEQAGPVR